MAFVVNANKKLIRIYEILMKKIFMAREIEEGCRWLKKPQNGVLTVFEKKRLVIISHVADIPYNFKNRQVCTPY